MRFSLLSSCFLVLAACSADATPEIPPPAPTVPNAAPPAASNDTTTTAPTTTAPTTTAPTTTATASTDAIPDTVMESKEGPAVPVDLDDPAAKAECAQPRVKAGSLKSASPELDAAYDVEASLTNGGTDLELRLLSPMAVSDDEVYGRLSYGGFDELTFHIADGLEVGSYPAVDGREKLVTFGCARTKTVTGSSYNPPGPLFPSWNLTITNQTATRVEGWYERTERGKTTRVEFSAPISDAGVTRMTSVCCLGQ